MSKELTTDGSLHLLFFYQWWVDKEGEFKLQTIDNTMLFASGFLRLLQRTSWIINIKRVTLSGPWFSKKFLHAIAYWFQWGVMQTLLAFVRLQIWKMTVLQLWLIFDTFELGKWKISLGSGFMVTTKKPGVYLVTLQEKGGGRMEVTR